MPRMIKIELPHSDAMVDCLRALALYAGEDEVPHLTDRSVELRRVGDDVHAERLKLLAFAYRYFEEGVAAALRADEQAEDEQTILCGLAFIGPPRKDGAK